MMTYPLIKNTKNVLATLLFGILLPAFIQAQDNEICEDNDCSSQIFTVQLNEPTNPTPAGNYTRERTDNFIAAYKQFIQVSGAYANNSDWKSKRNASQVGGKSCLRHYQLESRFAHEYSQNADFKSFVEGQPGGAPNFMEKGFESSRRGLNLERRMKRNCPDELKEADKKPGPKRQDLVQEYDKLGKELGYFDDQGNLLKPLKDLAPPTAATGQKLSKKEQVNQLRQQVAALPVGQSTKDKIDGVKNDLAKAKPKLGLFKKAMGLLNSRLATFLPGPLGLVGKMKTVNDLLGGLKNFAPKISVPGLLSKIGNLFKRGKDLGGKAKDLVDRSNKLKDKIAGLDKKANDLENEIDQRTAAINDLQKKLDDLAQKKAELTQKLEDKPKKILDELKQQVGDVKNQADDLVDKVKDETKLKDEILDQLKDLEAAKQAAEDELKQVEDEFEQLKAEGEQLEEEAKAAAQEVEEVKKQEQQLEGLQDELDKLKPEEELEKKMADCEEDLKSLLVKITGMDKKQEKMKKKMGGLLGWPKKIMGKLSDLKLFQNKLKLPQNGVPVADKALAKVDGLLNKANALGSVVEILTGKKSKLQETIEGYDKKLDNIKGLYEAKASDLNKLEEDLIALIAEKSGVKEQLAQAAGDVEKLDALAKDFINRYNIFDDKSDCNDKGELEDKVEELEKEQEKTEPEIDELEKELEKAEQEEEQLEEDTKEVEKEIEEEAEKAEELKKEEEAIKEEYGTDVKLEPVTTEEWAESFEVERPYWDAVFHPDDEVVEGQKGRYFEVKLKDAEKNVKLLFGPGEYCMSKSAFRKRYGSTIGSFVTEALHAMKKADQGKVKLFIQGSADIAGHKTFSGKLDDKFYYEDISVLPQQEDDSERFKNSPVDKEIPDRNFRNQHLPDLRGQYLAEMIKVYSKKFDPIVLEGAVKDFQDEEERNAIIYLFIPEEMVTEYGG